MNKDEIIRYYDDLMRLAVSKCGSQADAEDLVGDTIGLDICIRYSAI